MPGEESDARFVAEAIRSEAAYQAVKLGREAMARATTEKIPPSDIARLGRRLSTEGFTLVEASGDTTSMARMPMARGAAGRLEAVRAEMDEATVAATMGRLFSAEYVTAIQGLRGRIAP